MTLVDQVLNTIIDKPSDDIKVGPSFVGVRIGNRVGVAHRVDSEMVPIRYMDDHIGSKIVELIHSEDPIHTAVATAAINALITPKYYHFGNVFDLILSVADTYNTIGIVGKFPVIEKLKKQDCNLYSFEKKELPGFLPESQEKEILPKCDLVIITGTTFVNKTLEKILKLCNGYVMVIGPTTPLSNVLFNYGVDLLAGIISNDKQVLSVISHGGGTKEFKKYVDTVYIKSK